MPDIKTDVQGLYRSTETNAILNKDNKALLAYKKRKEQARLLSVIEKRLTKLELVIEELKNRLDGNDSTNIRHF